MKNKNYKVYRNNIYAGKVIKNAKIYRYDGSNPYLNIETGTLLTQKEQDIRTILFVPNKQKLADDLLYNSPKYPILNITDDETCLKLTENDFIITYVLNLEPLLKYFGYNEKLGYQDILKIRKTFFNDHWFMDNCELFGIKEIFPEELENLNYKLKIKNLNDLKEIIKFKFKHFIGYRKFYSTTDQILSDEFFNALDDLGDPSIRDIKLGNYYAINPFKPHKIEGPIKKLK